MKAVLTKPLVCVQLDTRLAEVLPDGAEIEVFQNSPRGWIELSWHGSSFSAFPDELRDACVIAEMS